MTKCYKCAQPIKFKTLGFRDGRDITIPFNPDGSKHTPTCNKVMKVAKAIYNSTLEDLCQPVPMPPK